MGALGETHAMGLDVEDIDKNAMVREPNSKDNSIEVTEVKVEEVIPKEHDKYSMYYEIEDVPSGFATIFLSLQVQIKIMHLKQEYCIVYKINSSKSYFPQVYLMMAGTALSGPRILTEAMCMADDDEDKAKVFNLKNKIPKSVLSFEFWQVVATFMLVAGLVTILQSSFGTRLPIVQGGSAAFLVSTLAILNRPELKCPEKGVYIDPDERRIMWRERLGITVFCI